ncbi:unnamed protein product [Cylicostephanus goldi]|uniref:Uncharacterized protein n=1 Tax=Cylicostephanus goldi TaxID=71465 RepID=A0A3P6RW66_CYLGO|nr:unnamed protein product [Cylicostephanus goldi]
MEIVRTLLKTNENFTYDEDQRIPEVRVWLKEIDTLYATFLTFATIFTVIVWLLAAVQLYHIIRYVSNARIQTDLYYLALMFPVTTICNMAGMYIPRAALFLYFMFCLFVVVSLLFNIFGSRKEMSDYLLEKGIRISFQVPPLCFLKFLPDVPSTE